MFRKVVAPFDLCYVDTAMFRRAVVTADFCHLNAA